MYTLFYALMPAWYAARFCLRMLFGAEGFGAAFAAWLVAALAAWVQFSLWDKYRRGKWLLPAGAAGVILVSCLAGMLAFVIDGTEWLYQAVDTVNIVMWQVLWGTMLGFWGRIVYHDTNHGPATRPKD